MAREVIADVDFGDETLNSTLARIRGNIGGLETQTVKTANVFTNRMFNMRTAAMAFLGGFTVAGAIVAIKNFIEFAAKGDPAFKSMATSSTVMQNSLAEAVRSMPGFHAAIVGIDKLFQHIAAGGKLFKALMTLDSGNSWEIYKQALIDVKKEQEALLHPASQIAEMYRVSWADINQAGKDAWQTWKNFHDIVNESSSIIVEDLDPIITQLDLLQEKLALVQEVGASVGQELAQAFLEGGVSLREALAQVLKQVAIALFVKAGEYFALGLAALTPWGAATLGPAPLYFKAAGAFAAAGAAVGAFGIGVGGRGAARSGGGASAGASATALGGGGTSQTIYLTIEGNATHDLIDQAIDLISTRLRDGVSGGNFNGQLVRTYG